MTPAEAAASPPGIRAANLPPGGLSVRVRDIDRPGRLAGHAGEGDMAHLKVKHVNDVAILRPHGYLMGGDETEELEKAIADLLVAGNRRLVVDLLEVIHMNSLALRAMIDAHKSYANRGGKIKLCHLTDRIQNALVITKLAMVFDVCGTELQAIEGFQSEVAPSSSGA